MSTLPVTPLITHEIVPLPVATRASPPLGESTLIGLRAIVKLLSDVSTSPDGRASATITRHCVLSMSGIVQR